VPIVEAMTRRHTGRLLAAAWASLLVIVALVLLTPSGARAQEAPVFLAPIGTEVAPGWILEAVDAQGSYAARARVSMRGRPDLLIDFVPHRDASPAYCRTPRFNITYKVEVAEGVRTDAAVDAVMKAVCALAARPGEAPAELAPSVDYRPRGAVPPVWSLGSRRTLAAALAVAALAFLALSRPVVGARLERAGAWVERRWPWLLLGLIAVMAPLRLWHLDVPFDLDYATQRAFYASATLTDILLHREGETRHPPLFYLVLHAFERIGGLREVVLRLPAALFSLTAAWATFLLARLLLGAPRALLVVALLVASAPFLAHSRDASSVTLATTLVVATLYLFLRCLEEPPRRAHLVGLVLAHAAMLYCYYSAVLVVLAEGLVLLVHQRRRAAAPVWLSVGAATALGLLAGARWQRLFAELGMRDLARAFPTHVWGDREGGEFTWELVRLCTPPGAFGPAAWALLMVGAMVGARRLWRTPPGLLLGALFALALVTATVGTAYLRLKPYYVIWMLPPVFVVLTAGATGWGPAEPRRRLTVAASAAAFGFVLFGYGAELAEGAPRLHDRRQTDSYARLGAAIRAGGGPDRVVADPTSMHTILLYYAFSDPVGAFRSCRMDEALPLSCGVGDERLTLLTADAQLAPGWEETAVSRLRQLGDAPFWFVYHEQFHNEPLHAFVTQRCAGRGRFGPLSLFRCPAGDR
jgi:hypothetical protein